ncbi:MAG: biotin/lipoyl-containing protein [Eubacteriales bacterium]|nr:biotin/lipoyl-containing protein [Eubacteriales bacterium]
MRTFNIKVNGVSYQVEVEETAGAAAAPVAAAPSPVAAAPVAAPAAPAAPAPVSAPVVNAEGEKVVAPMPGTILSIKASVGQQVKKNDVLLILEAMKMENEIVAPVDGTVAQIAVKSGDSVNSGDPLVVIQ